MGYLLTGQLSLHAVKKKAQQSLPFSRPCCVDPSCFAALSPSPIGVADYSAIGSLSGLVGFNARRTNNRSDMQALNAAQVWTHAHQELSSPSLHHEVCF